MELSELGLSSLSISKGSVYEEMTMTQAAMEDALSRREDTISNERIRKGDRILDTYTVQDEAISGGMGSVWRVHHESWNTDLAMKRPQPKFFSEGSQRRKAEFIAECENWINLGLHPNIVSCYYVREIGGVPTIFSEWMDNGSLKDRIRDGSLYQGTEAEVQERILDIAIQTARGLAYSHEKGLIHQDIKPGNILLSKNWDAKIADFGLAKARSQMDSGNTLSTGYTLEYCPKEQAEGAALETWMDIYAWALTVLEMYCGERTWKTGADLCVQPQRYAAGTRVAILPQLSMLIVSCLKSKISTPANTAQLLDELISIYQTVVGIAYYREAVNTLNDTANTLHNRALSYLDIGKPNIAVELWERAQKTDHTCFPAAYSYSLFLWNKGEISDTEFHNRVFSFPTSSKEVALAKLRVCLCMRADDIELQQTIDDLNRFPLNKAEHALTEKAAAILKTPLPHAYNEEFTHFLPAKMFNDYFPNLEYTDEQIPFVIREKHGMRRLRTLDVQTAINTGQEIDEWLTGFTPDGIALMQGAWMTKRTIRLPDPDVFFPYELSRIESTEARTLAEKQVFHQYRIAKEYYEKGDYQGSVRPLRACLQNGTLLHHQPSLELWSSLSKHFIRTKFIGVAVTQEEATPIPERTVIPEEICQKSATVFDDYACISCDGITKLTLDYSRKVIGENMNGNNDVEVEYRLTGTDICSGNIYFRIVPFDFLCEDDDDRPISRIQVKMVEPGVFQKWSQYYDPQTLDFANSDAIPDKVIFMLPGQIEMHNTTEGIQIGDFLIQDSLTEFRPYYDSDVISCKKYNYRLIFDYDTSSRPSGCTHLSSMSDSHSNNMDSHPSIEAVSDNPKPQNTGRENWFGKITRLLRKHK